MATPGEIGAVIVDDLVLGSSAWPLEEFGSYRVPKAGWRDCAVRGSGQGAHCGEVAGYWLGTEVEAQGGEHGCRVSWRDGSHLGVDELARQLRYLGRQLVALGLELARGG